jgi:serine/threonine protein phosphatase PrpC
LKKDKFIKTGSTHFICQDYILSREDPNCIILADGCSQVEDSDIGARLLCLSAAKYLKTYKSFLGELDYHSMGHQIIFNAEVSALAAGISPSCLSATLIIAFYYDGYIYIMMYGDGNLILLDHDNELFFSEVSYTDNKPFYLSYFLSPENLKSYKKEKIKKFEKHEHGTIEYNFDSTFFYRYPIDKYKVIAIASDGLSSWSPKLDSMEIFKNSVIYKNMGGVFLQRRMIRFISDLEKQKFNHADDISIGAFYLGK